MRYALAVVMVGMMVGCAKSKTTTKPDGSVEREFCFIACTLGGEKP